MKKATALMLCIALTAFAATRTVGSGSNAPGSVRGSYTVVETIEIGLSDALGMALQDDVANSVWIANYGLLDNIEYDLSIGIPTGNVFNITNSLDPDDEAYCEYASGNQFFFGDYVSNTIGVFSNAGVYVKSIDGPASWPIKIMGMGAGHDMLYCSGNSGTEIAWGGPYTGTESSVTWTTAPFAIVYGMAVYGDNLFVCCKTSGEDNIFIFYINPDGSVNMTPEWSCEFTEDEPSGGIDWDGTYLWVYPQNADLYKLDIDWTSGALNETTWGGIKADF